jgi:hypothetical protein
LLVSFHSMESPSKLKRCHFVRISKKFTMPPSNWLVTILVLNLRHRFDNFCNTQWVEAMRKFQDAAELVDAEQRMKKTMWGQFWSSHQRFFKYLCIAAKVKHAVHISRFALKKSCLGLQLMTLLLQGGHQVRKVCRDWSSEHRRSTYS